MDFDSTQAPTPSIPSPPAPQPPTPPARRWLWAVAGIAVLAAAGGLILAFQGRGSGRGPASTGSPGAGTSGDQILTVGQYPYLYPCSLVSRAEVMRTFGFDAGDEVGSVDETSALPARYVSGGTDLASIAPNLNSLSVYFSASCAFTMAKQGARTVDGVEVQLTQYETADKAEGNFKVRRSDAGGGDFAHEGNITAVPKLPSFPDTSFIKLPNPNGLRSEQAFVLHDNILFELDYAFEPGDTTDAITPKLDALAKIALGRAGDRAATKPNDLTGLTTQVGTFVDLCHRLDLKKISQILQDIHYRPDNATCFNTYGSLPGSLSAGDGVRSIDTLGFNTSGDRTGLAKAKKLSPSDAFPHQLTLAVNRFDSPAAAQSYLNNQKGRQANPASGVRPTITDQAGLGEAAYLLHKESQQDTSVGGQSVSVVAGQDLYVIRVGQNVVTIGFVQVQTEKYFPTQPLTISADEIKQVLQQITQTLKK